MLCCLLRSSFLLSQIELIVKDQSWKPENLRNVMEKPLCFVKIPSLAIATEPEPFFASTIQEAEAPFSPVTLKRKTPPTFLVNSAPLSDKEFWIVSKTSDDLNPSTFTPEFCNLKKNCWAQLRLWFWNFWLCYLRFALTWLSYDWKCQRQKFNATLPHIW